MGFEFVSEKFFVTAAPGANCLPIVAAILMGKFGQAFGSGVIDGHQNQRFDLPGTDKGGDGAIKVPGLPGKGLIVVKQILAILNIEYRIALCRRGLVTGGQQDANPAGALQCGRGEVVDGQQMTVHRLLSW